MAFYLGAHKIDEILAATAQNFDGDLLYTLSELANASIEITAESSDFTDKKGNVIRTKYRSKSGTFNATHAMLHPAVMNAGSGSDILQASTDKPIQMPKIVHVAAGGTLNVSDAIDGTIRVIGLYNNGANGAVLTQGTAAVLDETFALSDDVLTVPAAGENAPIQYLVRYERNVESGIAIINRSDKFPIAQRLTLQCAYEDPCNSELRACYIYLPNFMPDPNMTINFDDENQEIDFNGNLNIDYCSLEKNLFFIYYPDSETVVTGVVDGGDVTPVNP